MERYLVKLVYRKKPTVKLFFETLEKAVLVFNKKAKRRSYIYSYIALIDCRNGKTRKIAVYPILSPSFCLSLYDNCKIVGACDDIVYTIIAINESAGRLKIADINLHTRPLTREVDFDDIAYTSKNSSTNYCIKMHHLLDR